GTPRPMKLRIASMRVAVATRRPPSTRVSSCGFGMTWRVTICKRPPLTARSSRNEVVALLEIIDDAWLGGLPVHQLAHVRARGRTINPRTAPKSETLGHLLWRNRNHRYIQMSTAHFRNRPALARLPLQRRAAERYRELLLTPGGKGAP